ncbi:uncharacterized protein SPSK_01860 [Sporothrix schenckii 1099-18]|uniref:Uncharacterized protein n=2 Tax=Sporothrix schenckii TaxID=29908 RepID=U7PJC5_SPOS1|nr:uncharacterized protein SPSK_01860 [Sporothrix schenckii 1099-18]ERS95011.1 hypothetical protein HMPREF1624_08500 [Sporothrix schenckii ATCC 58251]KJR87387.1 hypothetical protein SPSK_01860 [Sporothrix schenckii 1099-18]
MSRYYDDDDGFRRRPSSSHGRGRHHHDLPPEDDYSDSAGLPPMYLTNAPGGGRLPYDPNVPVFPPPPNASDSDFGRHGSLQVPPTRHRPRSQPPVLSTGRSELSRRGSDRSDRSPSPDRFREGSHSPLEKVKHAADKTFSTSKSGIGVGVLGAIVGGFAAHEASEAASRARDKRDHRHHSSRDHQKATLISTIVGAAVGGLGANAIEKRVEHRRQERDKDDHDWDRDHRPQEFGYHGGGTSRGISDRPHSHARSSRGDDDSDDDYESGGRRGRRNNRERNLVISRSPSASLSRSRSNSRTRVQRPQHGGTADSYYNSSRSYDDRDDRR